jgi:HAE1 family hydrophobic/amphiphilic exporter-1
VDRNKAGEMGASIQDISGTLRLLVGGLDVSTFDDSGEQYDIHLQAEESYRNTREILNLLTVPSTKAGPVAITNLLTLENTDSPSQINRLNRRRQVTITANNAPGVGETEILDGIATAVKMLNLPADYASGSAGRSKEMAKAGKAFMVAFFMAFIFMYLILAAQFESWVHPFTILLALPLTLPFAILSLILFQSVGEHLLHARHPRALRHGEKERHPANRPHQPASRQRHGPPRCHPARQQRASAPHPHDHARLSSRA